MNISRLERELGGTEQPGKETNGFGDSVMNRLVSLLYKNEYKQTQTQPKINQGNHNEPVSSQNTQCNSGGGFRLGTWIPVRRQYQSLVKILRRLCQTSCHPKIITISIAGNKITRLCKMCFQLRIIMISIADEPFIKSVLKLSSSVRCAAQWGLGLPIPRKQL